MRHTQPTPPEPPPYLGETRAQSLQRKLPYYLLGLAIGCVMVGVMVLLRQMSTSPPPPPSPGAPTSPQPK